MKNMMTDSINKASIITLLRSEKFVFAISGFLGAVFFVHVYGVKVLNFTYTDWLAAAGGDTSQHYFGWEFFRNSDWNFPIGLTDGFTYPYKESIMFTDSIPLFAIIFKAISFMLPHNFQYFGLFGILMYILQGAFGGLIIKRLTNDSVLSILGSLFFTMSSFLTWRMYAHTSLSAHFLILASIYVCITKDTNRTSLKKIFLWGGLLSLSAWIHPYFVLMVSIFMVLYFGDDIFEYKKPVRTFADFGASIGILMAAMYLAGAFYSNSPKSEGGLGFFSTNINSIVNPGGMSAFLKDFPLSTNGQYEGNAYIGCGMIVLIFIALFAFADRFKIYFSNLTEKKFLRRTLLGVIAFVSFYVLALSPAIGFNNETLFTYKLPEFYEKILSIFRATGRFVWPSVYLTMISAVCVTVKHFRKTASAVVLGVLIFLQYQDMTDYFRSKGAYFREEHVWNTNLRSDIWSVIAKDYKHLLYTGTVDNMYPVAKFAVENKLTVNDTYVARKNTSVIEAYKRTVLDYLGDGKAKEDTVYFFSVPPVPLIFDKKLFVYEFDGMTAGFSRRIENDANMQGITFIDPNQGIDIMPAKDINMRNATDHENERVLYKEGASWSNYYDLRTGVYTYEWSGGNFDNAIFDMSYGDGSAALEITNIERSNTSFKFDVFVSPEVKNLHARCFNASEGAIHIRSIYLRKQAD